MEKGNSVDTTAQVVGVEPGCTRCHFAFAVRVPGEISVRYQCKWGPPQPVPAVLQGSQIGCKTGRGWVTDPDWCFQFAPRGQGV